jgi:hypothetical protein
MGWGPKAPKPDKQIGEAAKANAAIAGRQMDLAEREYADTKAMNEKFAPLFEQLMNQASEQSARDIERSDGLWDEFTTYFQPVRQEYAQRALDYDTAGRRDEAAATAAGEVGKAFSDSREAQQRSLGRSGVTMSSGRALTLDAGNRLAQAKATAAARTAARNQVENTGLNLMGSVANMSAGLPTQAIQTSQAGLGAGNTAIGTVGAQQGMNNAGVGLAGNLYGNAVGANSAAGNLLLGQYQARSNAAAQAAGGMGSMMGGLGALAGAAYSIYSPSSKKLKHKRGNLTLSGYGRSSRGDKKPLHDMTLSDGAGPATKKLSRLDNDVWEYKEGVADEGVHAGPYAEDVQREFGDDVAPGGKMIDLRRMGAINRKAVDELEQQVAKLEQRLDAMEAA